MWRTLKLPLMPVWRLSIYINEHTVLLGIFSLNYIPDVGLGLLQGSGYFNIPPDRTLITRLLNSVQLYKYNYYIFFSH